MGVFPMKFVSPKLYFRNVSLIRFFSASTLSSRLEASFLEDPTIHTDNSELPSNGFIDNGELPSDGSIELNTVEVVEAFNNLKNDPNLALTFFDLLKGGGFSHNVNTYAAFVRILCYCKLDGKLGSYLSELIRKETDLDFEIMELFRAVVDGIEIESERSRIAIMLCDSIVKTFVDVGMFNEAIDVLSRSNCCGFVPHISSCNFLMNRLVERGKVDMAVAIYMQLKKIGLSPNDYTYSIAIKAFCVKGNVKEALDLLERMEKDGVTPNEFAYTACIEGLSKHGMSDLGFGFLQSSALESVYAYKVVIQGFCNKMQLDKAEEAFVDMQNKGLIPDVHAYSALICGLCRAGNLLKAVNFHDEMMLRGIETNCFIVSSILVRLSQMCMATEVVNEFEKFERMGIFLDAACYNVVMDALCKLGEGEKAADMLDEMKERRICLDIVNYTTLIDGYFLKGQVGKAMDLIKEMEDNGHVPDIIFYSVLAGGLSRNGYAEKAFEVLDIMKSQGIEPNTVTHNKIIEGLCIAGMVDQARAFCDELNCVENYSSLVKGYCLANHTDKAFQLFINLSNCGDIMNSASCWELLSTLVTEGKYKNALLVLARMVALRIYPTNFMIGKLIGMLCEVGNLEIAQYVYVCLIKEGLAPDMITYTVMINEYCRKNCLREACALLSHMNDIGMKPDVVTYTVLFGNCSQINTRNFLCEMIKRGIPFDAICYTVLIDKDCKTKNIQDAESLFDDLIDQGLEPDTVTYKALLAGFFRAAEFYARTPEILSQRSSQSSTPMSYQDGWEAYFEKTGGVGPRGSVYGVGSAAGNFFSYQIRAPRREATRTVQISRNNAQLRTQVDSMKRMMEELVRRSREAERRAEEAMHEARQTTQEFEAFRLHMQQFMADMNKNQA